MKHLFAILLMALFLVAGPVHGHSDRSAPDGARAIYLIAGDRDLAQALDAEVDLWAFLPQKGLLVVALTVEQRRTLEARGLNPILDHERTASLERTEVLTGAGIPGFPCYRTVEETLADLQALATARPDLATFSDFGDSWRKTANIGGYDLQVLRMTRLASTAPKPKFVLIAAMHAREYSTAELATRFAERLINGYGVDPDITWILDHNEVHVIAQLNPDGRKEAESGLLWRKNADNNFCANSNSRGVDLNRNSSVLWGGTGSSGIQCAETYRGPSAASEPETAAIEAYMAQVFPDQRGPAMNDAAPANAEGLFISLHSFGELVLFPWEATTANSANHAQLETLGRKFGFYNQYTVCQDCLSATAGTTVDVAYGVYGVAAYTFELGNNFFESCAGFESTIAPDNLNALIFGAKASRRPYLEPAGPEAFELALSASSVAPGTPLTITARLSDNRFFSGGQGTEPSQNIAAAFFSIDTPIWNNLTPNPMNPVDGGFNAVSEQVQASIDTTALSAGRHLIFVAGDDAGGRRGVPSALFLEILDGGEIFRDGFESGTTSAWSSTSP